MKKEEARNEGHVVFITKLVCDINCEELLNSCVISRNEGHVA